MRVELTISLGQHNEEYIASDSKREQADKLLKALRSSTSYMNCINFSILTSARELTQKTGGINPAIEGQLAPEKRDG